MGEGNKETVTFKASKARSAGGLTLTSQRSGLNYFRLELRGIPTPTQSLDRTWPCPM